MELHLNPRILIVKLSAIGDVIQTLPALNTLRTHYPWAHITWLVEASAARVIKDHPALDRVIVSDRQAWPKAILSGRIRSTLGQIRGVVHALRNKPYDLILDFQGLLKSGIWVGLAKGVHKVGFGSGMQHQEGSYWFLNHRVPAVSMEMHALERYLWLLHEIGISHDRIQFRMPITQKIRQQTQQLLIAQGIDLKRPFVALNPMTRWETKHWRSEGFAKLADRLVHKAGVQVVFCGSAPDRVGIDHIRGMMVQPGFNLAGLTDLLELGALFELARCLISTDSGPMHLATAVGARVVALFGPTAPWRTGPYGQDHAVVRLDLPCSPCYKRRCELHHHDCMNTMTVDRVWKAVADIVGDTSLNEN